VRSGKAPPMVSLKWRISVSLLAVCVFPALSWAAIDLRDEGTSQAFVWNLDCVGANIACTTSGADGTLTISGIGAGDIETVGDVASGAAFDGTQGTVLTFNNASGDQTLTYSVGGDLDFNFSDDLNLRDATPHLQLIDSTASEDDFELYADGSQCYLTNVTDAIELVRFDSAYNLYLRPKILISGAVDDASTGTERMLRIYNTTPAPQGNEMIMLELAHNDAVEPNIIWLRMTAVADTAPIAIFQVSETVIGTDMYLGGSGIIFSDASGGVVLTGNGPGTDENLQINLNSSNVVNLSTSSGVTTIDLASMGLTLDTDQLITLGSDTFEFDGTTNDFELSDDLSLTDATPHLQLIDSTASEDDFEWYADASQVYLTNVTDAVELLRWSSANAFFLRGSAVTYAWPTADGTNGQFLTTNGSGTMTWTTSSGSGDITDVYNCASGDCASIALADTDLLNMSAVSVSTTTEGLILPQHATDCSTAGTAEGQVCWEADANTLYIGNGATVTAIGSGSDTNADKEFVWPAAATFALEPAEAWAPIFKDAGTNLDMVTVDFDQSTDECRTVMFFAPPDITAGGTVTFSVYSYEASAITGDMIWDLRHNAGIAEGVDPDVALTTEASSADTVQGTAGQVTVTTWTETQTNLAWAASDLVVGEFCRDANHASDTLAADAKVIAFAIRIPRS